jgi:hypothetical protein
VDDDLAGAGWAGGESKNGLMEYWIDGLLDFQVPH